MSNWDKLSMREKAAYIKVGVQNGLTSISDIKEYYDKFREVNASAGNLVNAIQENTKSEIYLGKPSHNYDFTQSEEWANQHGYYPDSRGHRDDRVKKPAHPTHPSRGTFRSMNEFELSDIGMQDPNYTLYGLNDGGQDPQAIMTYKGGIVLPEITITPKGNYVYNSYDNITNKLGGGSWLNSQESGKTVNEKNKATDIGYTPFSYNNKMIYGDITTIDEGLIPFFYENQVLYRNNNDNTYYADNKGTIPVKDKDNNMLYAYYNQHIKNLSNRDIIKFYTNRYRNTQNKWMAASKPLEYNTRSPKIEVTKGKSSGVLVPTAMIDSIVSHTKAHNYTVNKEAGLVDDPYTALAVASIETDFGKHLNHGELVKQSGLTPAVFNDERYYLPDQSYYAGLSTALRNYYNELSKTQKMEDKQENFVKHYLDLKNLFNDPKAVEYVGNALKKDLIYKRFKNYTMQDLLPPPNVYDHILKEIYSGKYNSGNANYNSNVRKNAEILRSDPNVRRYVQKAVKKYDIGGLIGNNMINKSDDNGLVIPLSRRDDFSNPSVRYRTEGKINKFDEGGKTDYNYIEISKVNPEYALKEVRDASGNVLPWEQVLQQMPNYKIAVNEQGVPVAYENKITTNEYQGPPVAPQSEYYDQQWLNQEKRKQKRLERTQSERQFAKDLVSLIPGIGEGIDAYDFYNDVQDKNYTSAALRGGMYLLPNIIEKPLKYVSKFGKDVISKMLKNFDEYKLKNILETEYKKEAQRLINTIPESFKGSSKFEKNSGLVVRGQRSTDEGMFIGEGHGSILKDGKIIPGQSRLQGQRNFSWWNENEAFSSGFKLGKPMDTFIIMDKTDIPGLEYVRNMNEHVGQWRPGSKAFVRKSEMVTPEIVNINRGRIYHLDPFEFSLGNTIYTENKLMNSISELFPIRSYTDYRQDPKQYMWTDQHLIPITLWHKLGGKLRNNKFGGGGFTFHTRNDIVDTGLAFVPFYSTTTDIKNAIKNPTLGNFVQ